ncbi:MAG: class I SAM-dependent methyltransferase [Xanthobacteraceae bacterium]
MSSNTQSGLVSRVGRSARHRLQMVRLAVARAILRDRLRRKRALPDGTWHPLFKFPLIDLGEVEAGAFAGVVSPAPEVGALREGVDAQFLADAEAYYAKYQSFDYWRKLIAQVTDQIGLEPPSQIVEFGCGFGNSTLPLLDLFPQAKVIASDISPNLLAILNRLLTARGLRDRCIAVAMDAQKDFIKPGCADLVIGSAILHHLADPSLFVARAFEILRPGGAAVFFEPLEGGYAILRLICQEVAREAKRRGERGSAITMARRVAASLEPQIFRQALPGWSNVNDKWAFPRSVLDGLAKSVGAQLTIYPLHDNVGQFRRAFAYMLETYGKSKIAELPQWAWDIFDRYDTLSFSPEMLTDLALEGCAVFRKGGNAETRTAQRPSISLRSQ